MYNAYGIEMAAARTSTNPPASWTAAVLESAALIPACSREQQLLYLDPVINPERAVQRHNAVLAQMVKYEKLRILPSTRR
ncbi:hypothetical protein ACU4GD_11815 [Cupriavidus basilensis]